MPLMAHIVDHPQGQELEVISNIIDADSTICQYIFQDLSAEQVISQTRRRVVLGPKVPTDEKVLSIVEEQTDIIVKDRRDPIFGHKICLIGGASNLILDCVIFRGNPANTDLVILMLLLR